MTTIAPQQRSHVTQGSITIDGVIRDEKDKNSMPVNSGTFLFSFSGHGSLAQSLKSPKPQWSTYRKEKRKKKKASLRKNTSAPPLVSDNGNEPTCALDFLNSIAGKNQRVLSIATGARSGGRILCSQTQNFREMIENRFINRDRIMSMFK